MLVLRPTAVPGPYGARQDHGAALHQHLPVYRGAAVLRNQVKAVEKPSSVDKVGVEQNGLRAQPVVPLTRQQLTDFIHDGFILVKPRMKEGDAFHQLMYERAAELYKQENVGNNFVTDIPGLDSLLDAPEIRGALNSILGDDYVMTASRHCHISQEGSVGQQLHQDDFFGFENIRHAAPMELMIMYYPQAVSSLMGPTAVIPGSQYSRGTAAHGSWGPQDRRCDEKPLTIPKAGTCMLMHWHLWHRGTQQAGGASVPVRYMFKLQFRRTRPLHPAPYLLRHICDGYENPFLINMSVPITMESQGATRALVVALDHHNLDCASVWAALTDTALPSRIEVMSSEMRRLDAGLALACGVQSALEALPTLVSTVLGPDELRKDTEPKPFCAQSEDAHDDRRREAAAAALQFLPTTLSSSDGDEIAQTLAAAFGSESASLPHRHSDWRLECIGALPAILTPCDALTKLVPLLEAVQAPRAKFHVLMSIYRTGVICNAPASASWAHAAHSVQLQAVLMQCVYQLSLWGKVHLARVGMRQANDDAGIRYALVEGLRCIGRFCSLEAAVEALRLTGGPALELKADDAGWRRSFALFLERRRRCLITHPSSSF